MLRKKNFILNLEKRLFHSKHWRGLVTARYSPNKWQLLKL
jgi:hypothetical protein